MRKAVFLACAVAVAAIASTSAQVPANIESELKKIGQIVDPACTAKLYRPLMPANDFNTYWPPDAAAPKSTAPLYPGVTIVRDQSFGPNTKDVLDIFMGEKGGDKRPVVIYVPGGAGNKIEQQVREGNAFYDNIARWATKNGMVGVLVQRHPGQKWDDGGRDLSMAVDWVHDNIAKYRGDPNHMVIWAHSAGNGPLGVYVGHADRWKNGVQVKGAIFMSGNPVPTVGQQAGRGGPGRGQGGPQPGVECGLTGASMTSDAGHIAGPSGFTSAQAGPGRGGPGGRGGPQLTDAERAERDNLPGFKTSKVKIAIAYAEWDPGVMDAQMPPNTVALHDELCKEGKDHCPELWMLKGESHMSEVFSLDSSDQTVAKPVLKFVKDAK
ncbi:MAG TPA: alpha/beta hydrolase [Vicinamibacterales bacterium]|nr:alpha/beta hydrolase [Vicinamibacterales bacterium]